MARPGRSGARGRARVRHPRNPAQNGFRYPQPRGGPASASPPPGSTAGCAPSRCTTVAGPATAAGTARKQGATWLGPRCCSHVWSWALLHLQPEEVPASHGHGDPAVLAPSRRVLEPCRRSVVPAVRAGGLVPARRAALATGFVNRQAATLV